MLIAEQQKLFDYTLDEIEQNEFILFDRLEKIKQIIAKYGEENFFLSFSGGKDSTVLHHLIDMAIPGNEIPRVFCNTGLEFRLIYKFVKSLQAKDKRIIMISPRKNIVKTLESVGYPFKSKNHSEHLHYFQKGVRGKWYERYLDVDSKSKYVCPKKLLYQFSEDFKLKVSDLCCIEFKKNPISQWQIKNNKIATITGMRKGEGGRRESIGCTTFNKKGELSYFHPLAFVSDHWEDWFIKKFDIRLCDLYYSPFNFKRTGCVGCPFNINIEKALEILKEKLPNEYRRAWLYFGPVYREYQRIGYRFKGKER